MRCAVACLPAPASASTRTGTSLCASSRITASTGRILALTPSTNASPAGCTADPSPLFAILGNNLPIFYLFQMNGKLSQSPIVLLPPLHEDCHAPDCAFPQHETSFYSMFSKT